MSDQTSICPYCPNRVALRQGAKFCHRCGRVPARVEWKLHSQIDAGPHNSTNSRWIHPSPEGYVYLMAYNSGSKPVALLVTISGTNPRLESEPEQTVDGCQLAVFALRCGEGEIDAVIEACSHDGKRQEWWETQFWRSESFDLDQRVKPRAAEQWLIGSPNIVFPSGGRKQWVHIRNSSPNSRNLDLKFPYGYELRRGWTVPMDQPLAAEKDYPFIIEYEREVLATKRHQEWKVPMQEPIPLHILPAMTVDPGPELVISIDYGTRNTGIRVRWRRRIGGKRIGQVDSVGPDGRFPSAMVLHRQGVRELFGHEAETYIRLNRGRSKTADEIEVVSLKTLLRTGEEPYRQQNRGWTTQQLLEIYFKHVFVLIDEYLEKALANRPLRRDGLRIRYMLTRPVLDYDEDDQIGALYEDSLRTAVNRQHNDADIVFVLEPLAAAYGIARTHKSDLLKLNGKAVGVIDSGGGTTDIAVARISVDRGHIVLAPIRAYDLPLTEIALIRAAFERFGVGDKLHFCGNALDYALAYKLLEQAGDMLESESGASPPDKIIQGDEKEFPEKCRDMKEGFVTEGGDRQYLNRSTSSGGSNLGPFQDVTEYIGLYLAHDQYDAQLLDPTLSPAIDNTKNRIGEREAELNDGIRPVDIQEVVCVGGTSVDGFVRDRLSSLFPRANRLLDKQMNAEARLNAVAEGAVWYGEPPYVPSPFTLYVEYKEGEEERREEILREGEPLPEVPSPKPFFLELDRGEECYARLLASGGGLPQEICVARSLYRNLSDQSESLTLSVSVTRDSGVLAELEQDDLPLGVQWHFLLREDQQ